MPSPPGRGEISNPPPLGYEKVSKCLAVARRGGGIGIAGIDRCIIGISDFNIVNIV